MADKKKIKLLRERLKLIDDQLRAIKVARIARARAAADPDLERPTDEELAKEQELYKQRKLLEWEMDDEGLDNDGNSKEKEITKLGGTKKGFGALGAAIALGGDSHVVAALGTLAFGAGADIFSGIGRMIAEKKAAPLSANNIAPNTARGTNIPGTPAPQATSELTPETSKLVEAGAPEKVEQSEMTNAEAVRAFRARGGAAPGAPEKTPTVVEKAKELRVANPQLTPAQAIAQARTLVKPKGLLSLSS
jgi:hypothetical protein